MFSDKADESGILQDQYKTSLSSLDLFDRIINVKLTVAGGEEYVIRSDYETYFPDLMSAVVSNDFASFVKQKRCYVRKCQYKPSIKIQYKRVSMSTPVSVDIYINNFFMLDKDGKMLKTFSNLDNPLRRVDVQLGYFGQFESALKSDIKLDDSSIAVSKLFDFNPDKFKGHGITVITMADVEYVQTDKLPPDMTVHIHGYVGNLYSQGYVEEGTDNYISKRNSITTIDYVPDEKTVLGKLLFECVTKNWLNPYKISTEKFTSLSLPMLHPEDKSDLTLASPMTTIQARKYGVQVFLSKEAEKKAKEYDKVTGLVTSQEEDFKEKLITIGEASNALAKVNLIKNAMGLSDFLAIDIPSTSNILVYRSEEFKNISNMLKGTEAEKEYKQDTVKWYWNNKLPAVYNITTDALCTVTCPFFFFLNPFQEFEFKSAYALSGLVSYYANFTASEDKFYALWQTISFATVEDVNECTIICTGSK